MHTPFYIGRIMHCQILPHQAGNQPVRSMGLWQCCYGLLKILSRIIWWLVLICQNQPFAKRHTTGIKPGGWKLMNRWCNKLSVRVIFLQHLAFVFLNILVLRRMICSVLSSNNAKKRMIWISSSLPVTWTRSNSSPKRKFRYTCNVKVQRWPCMTRKALKKSLVLDHSWPSTTREFAVIPPIIYLVCLG